MKKGKYFTNNDVYNLLKNISAALEIKGANPFRISAYSRAAASISNLTSEIKDIWDENKLSEIPGVGGNIASHLDELFKKGRSSHFENELKGLPPAMFEFLKVSGIGPKTAFLLANELGIIKKKDALAKLKTAAMKGKIRKIPTMGIETEKSILESLERIKDAKNEGERMLLFEAQKITEEIINYLKKSKSVLGVDPLGSLRRKVSTIGDIDISVSSNNSQKVIDWFTKYPKLKKIIKSGNKTASIVLTNGRQVDLYVKTPDTYGSLLQHFTGSKLHNIHLRRIALKKELSLSEHGIKNNKNGKIYRFSTEKDFYQFLGLEYIPPELREDRGELSIAKQKKLPRLIENKDILGDLHVHSSFPINTSHDLGEDRMEVMIEKAGRLKYKYIGFTEHNPAISGLIQGKALSLLSEKKDIVDKLNLTRAKKLNIRIFNGLEIDIRPNGKLAIALKGLETLDYAIGSIHSSLNLSKTEMTRRVIEGLSHPKIKIFAHPTGRMLNHREGYELDWEVIFAHCLKSKIALEINAYPDRLDLPDTLVKEAIDYGVMLSINSDSHNCSHMDFITGGVSVARRGWVTKKNVINSWPLSKLEKFLKT